MKIKGTAIFLDTSILIARFIHSPEAKRQIDERTGKYDVKVTSSVVRQEFKRRLLKEAKYLLDLLHRRNSLAEVRQHVVRLPDRWHKRKRNICLQTLSEVFSGADDAEQTERAKLYLHNLLTLGLDQFDGRVDQVVRGADCACSKIPIREVRPFQTYDFGTDNCSETEGKCGVQDYLGNHAIHLTSIRELIKNTSDEYKSDEIKSSEAFLDTILKNPNIAMSQNPCLTVGDLMIALESVGIPAFYTLNGKESVFFCHALRQILILRPVDPLSREHITNFDDDEERFTR